MRVFGLILAACMAHVAAARAADLNLIEPYGPDSSTGVTVALLQPGLAAELGRQVVIAHVPGGAGATAMARVTASAPDGDTLFVMQLLSPLADPGNMPSLTSMVPVAKLTSGFSAALIVSNSSPIRSYADLRALAATRTLTAAYNPIRLFTLPVAMVEGAVGQKFTNRYADTRAAVLAAIDSGAADFGFLPTISLASRETLPARPILTFGGARHPRLDVPTFREVEAGSERDAVTGAIAVFAPAGTPPAVAARLGEAFIAAGKRADVLAAATRREWPLQVDDAAVVRATMARDQRIVRDLLPR